MIINIKWVLIIFSDMKQFQFRLNELKDGLKSVFSDRTDDASAVQYFQVIICSPLST